MSSRLGEFGEEHSSIFLLVQHFNAKCFEPIRSSSGKCTKGGLRVICKLSIAFVILAHRLMHVIDCRVWKYDTFSKREPYGLMDQPAACRDRRQLAFASRAPGDIYYGHKTSKTMANVFPLGLQLTIHFIIT